MLEKLLLKTIKNIFIFILAIVIVVGAIAFVFVGVDIGDFKNTLGVDKNNQYVGESMDKMTIVEAVMALADAKNTVGDYEEMLPIITTALTNLEKDETVGAIVSIDNEKLKTMTIGDLSKNVGSVVTITATINTLQGPLGLDMGNFSQLSIYNDKYEATDLETIEGEKQAVEDAGGTFAYGDYYYAETVENAEENEEGSGGSLVEPTSTKISALNAETNYVNAFDEDGNLKAEADGKQLYKRILGISNQPINKAFGSFSERLGEVTLREFFNLSGTNMEGSDLYNVIDPDAPIDALSTFSTAGIELEKVIEPNGNKILENLIVDGEGNKVKIGELSSRLDELKLGEMMTIGESAPHYLKSLANYTIKQLETLDMTIEMAIDLSTDTMLNEIRYLRNDDGTFVLDENNEKVPTPVSKISSQVKFISLETLIGEEKMDGNIFLKALKEKGDVTVSNITTLLDSLTLSDVYGKNIGWKQVAEAETVMEDVTIPKYDETKALYGYNETEKTFTLIEDENGLSYTFSGYDNYYQIDEESGFWLFLVYDRVDLGVVGSIDGDIDENGNVMRYKENDCALVNLQDRINDSNTMFNEITMRQMIDTGFIDGNKVNDSRLYAKTLDEIIDLAMLGLNAMP